MTPLGRGLASLIPRRGRREADEIIEEIDTIEETEATEEMPMEDEIVSPEPEQEEQPEPTLPQAHEERRRISVFEELDDGEEIPMPEKPKVTPLQIDPETGRIEAVPVAEQEEQPAAQAAEEEAVAEVEQVEVAKVTKITMPVEEKTAAPKAKSAPKKVAKKEVAKKETAPVREATPAEARVLDKNVQYLALGDIEVNPEQPRRTFDEDELLELMQSLEQHGMLQPMVVMEKDDGSGYQIIAGERRYRAAKRLGWAEVPCVVRSGVSGDRNRLELALTENIQRENLNPVEEALGYRRLNEEYGMSHEEIGERVGKSRVAITNMLRILQLPAEIQRGLVEGKITTGHARAILMIPDEEKQLRFYKHVLEEGLTVRKTEIRARNIQRSMNIDDPLRKRVRGRPQLALKYEGDLQQHYGYNSRVKFNDNKNRFEVTFFAFSANEAEDLISMLLGRKEVKADVDADVIED